MRKCILILMIFFIGCSLQKANLQDGSEHIVTIKVESATDSTVTVEQNDFIQKTQNIPRPDEKLSMLTFIRGDKAYIKIFSGISTSDTERLWNDLIILKDLGIKKVELFINSPGGDAFQGLAIADHILREMDSFDEFTAYANGLVMSAAVPILAVCKHRVAAPGTVFLLHKEAIFKWGFANETTDDLETQAKMLKMIRKRYIGKLPLKTVTAEEWEAKICNTTYFGVEDALEWGLIDEIK